MDEHFDAIEAEEVDNSKNMLELISDKSHIHLHETVIETSILTFLKTAVKKN